MRAARSQLAGLQNAISSTVTFGRLPLVPTRSFAQTASSRGRKSKPPPAQRRTSTPTRPTIKHFEQYGNDPSQRVEIPRDEVDQLQEEHEHELAALDAELKQLTSKAIPNALAQIPKKDRERMGDGLKGLSTLPDIEKFLQKGKFPGLSTSSAHAVCVDGASSRERMYIQKFNKALLYTLAGADAARGTTEQDLWRWFSLCKQNVRGFLESISAEAWESLWRVYTFGESIDPDHVVILGEDMRNTNATMSSSQVVNYVQAVAATDVQKALSLWKEYAQESSKQYKDFVDLQGLGIGLLSSAGELEEAEKLADELMEMSAQREARRYIPVLIGWTKQDDLRALQVYRKLRAIHTMTMEDYDAVSLAFLAAGKKDLALAIFADMMVTADSEMAGRSALLEKMPLLLENLQKEEAGAPQVNALALKALTVIPKKFETKFFYASWIKKLIGMGEVDFAAMVADLMYERGIKPDAKHINGIIGGWLRQGNETADRKAEETAWAMIEQRLAFVQERESGLPGKRRMKSVFGSRDIPNATIETFSILVRHFLLSGRSKEIDKLNKKLEEAQILPNSFFMNHLLYALIRDGNAEHVWGLFTSMTSDLGVKPDINTYACLWDTMRVRVSEQADWPDFPDCRQLYAMMVEFSRNARSSEPISKETFEQILQCTMIAHDYAATIIALQAGDRLFGISPDDTTSKSIITQLARNQAVVHPLKRNSLGKSGQQQHLEHLKRELKKLEAWREHVLAEQSIDPQNISADERVKEASLILTMLLRGKLAENGNYVADDRAQDILSQTAADMGLPEINFS